MSSRGAASAATPEEAIVPGAAGRDGGPGSARRRLLVLAALALVLAAVAIVVINPFAGAGAAHGVTDNEYPTSLEPVKRQALSSQTQESATLGFAGDWTVRVPAGTAPTAVTQAQQSITTNEGMLSSARSSLSSDTASLAQARSTLSADQQQEAIDCAGDDAAQQSPSGNGSGAGGCAGAAQVVSTDTQAVTMADTRVSGDERSVTSAQQALATAQASLATAQAQETAYGQDATFTALPSAGAIIRNGEQLYAIEGEPVLLLYGPVIATRSFVDGMSAGPDVAELNANLAALGYATGLAGDQFTAGTAAAIRALQSAHGLSETGELLLGSVVFEPGPVRVTSVMPNVGVGSTVMPGPVLTGSSTAPQVSIQLDASLQGQVKVGDPITITLPDNDTTPGVVTSVGTVASSGSSPTIPVEAVPTDPAAVARLDQAPVNVAITTASVSDALVVPVDALLALASGGYAVEEVGALGVHHLVAVSTGLFDDADGLVQVSGPGLAAGQNVVVPGD